MSSTGASMPPGNEASVPGEGGVMGEEEEEIVVAPLDIAEAGGAEESKTIEGTVENVDLTPVTDVNQADMIDTSQTFPPATDTEKAQQSADSETFQDEHAGDDDDNNNGKTKKKRFINLAIIPTAVATWCASIPWSKFCTLSTPHGKALAGLLFVILVTVGIVCGAFVAVGTTVSNGVKSMMAMEHSLSADMMRHPGYTGELFPYGKITLRFDSDDMFLVAFRMEGLERVCTSCAWRIVEGTSCQDVHTLGADLWNPAVLDHSPYSSYPYAYYDAVDGLSTSTTNMFIGFPPQDVVGHAILVYAQDNSPLGCGILHNHGQPVNHQLRYIAEPEDVAPYDIPISGYIEMDFNLDDTFELRMFLNGLPPNCQACGVVIADGTDCQTDRGDALYRPTGATPESKRGILTPYDAAHGAVYQTGPDGLVEGRSFFLYNGYSFDEHEGKLVLLQTDQGFPIACGVLKSHRGRLEKPDGPVVMQQEVVPSV